jgi:hypothetical protein
MRLLYPIAFVILVGLLLAQFLPWWSIALAGAGAGYLWDGHRGRSFLFGFLGGFLLWTVAAILITYSTGSDLGDRFAKMMQLPANGTLLAVVSGVIAGLVAGFAAFTGDSIRRISRPKKAR